MLTIQQRRALEAAVRQTTFETGEALSTGDNVWEESAGVVQVKSGFGASGVKVDAIEFASGEVEVNGNWKMSLSGDDIDASRRESGTWVEKGGFIA